MTYITDVSFWKDIGYLEDSVTVPGRNTNLPDPTLTIPDQLAPNTGDLFSSITIPYEYAGLMDMSYLKLTINWNNADPQTFYGWIESVEVKSDTEDYPSTIVRWHVDLWRTYINKAHVGYGVVKRRPRGEEDPIQVCPYRYHEISTNYDDLIPRDVVGATEYWGLINCAIENSTHTEVETFTICAPLSADRPIYFKVGANTEVKQAPSLNDWISGRYDEIFGLAPTQISSAFITPLPPVSIKSGSGTQADPYVLTETVPTPTPRPTTRQGAYDDNREIIGFFGNVGFVLRNMEEVKTLAGIYTIPETSDGLLPIRARLITSQGTYTTSEVGQAMTVIPLDILIRNTFGNDTFDALEDGDTAVIYGQEGCYTSYNVDGDISDDHYLIQLTTGSMIDSSEFTYNNGTFGDVYVAVIGRPNALTITLNTTIVIDTADDFVVRSGQGAFQPYGYFYRPDNKFTAYEMSLPTEALSTDTEQLIVTDQNGIPIAYIPWGIPVKEYTIRNVVSATSAYVQIRFDGLRSAAEGLEVTVPLQSVPIASNSYSEYRFSGARDYDVQQRKLANEQALYEGIFGYVSGKALFGGIGQGSTTTTTKEIQTRGKEKGARLKTTGKITSTATTASTLGGVPGALVSSGLGVGSAIGQYALQDVYNQKLQSMEDTVHAKQIDAIITPSEGWDWLYHGQRIALTSLKPDYYSIVKFNKHIELNGIECDEVGENLDPLIDAGGPLMIADAIVTGECPIEAKVFISMRLSNGVRII